MKYERPLLSKSYGRQIVDHNENRSIILPLLLTIVLWALIIFVVVSAVKIAFGETPTPTYVPCATPTPDDSQVWGRSGPTGWAHIVQDATGVYHGLVESPTECLESEITESVTLRAVKVKVCQHCLAEHIPDGTTEFENQPQCWKSEGVK